MFKNYLKIALRNIIRNKGYSIINILGLAIGMACCLFIFLYIQEELSYDNHHKNVDRLYRVVMHFESESFTADFAKVGPPVGLKLREDFPQVESVARLMKNYRPLVKYENKKFYEERFYYAEPELFDIITFPFLQGNPNNALSRPNTIVISEAIAEKYFGDENPVGKTLTIDSKTFEIKGIIQNYPSNTHLKCDFLASFKTIEENGMNSDWGRTNFYTYVKLAPNVNAEDFKKQIYQIESHYRNKEISNRYDLQSVKRIHLHSHLAGETEPPGNPLYIYITSTIGLLILLIACINFMNLTTARFARRAREVGMRKVVGAKKRQLIFQFMGESIVMSGIAFVLAITIAGISLPILNELTNKQFTDQSFLQPEIIIISSMLILFVGFITGSYPSFILSQFRAAIVLKSGMTGSSKGSVLRKALVVAQFTVTILFIIGTLIVYKQLHFLKTTDLGFEKEQKLVLPLEGNYLTDMQYESVKSEFLKYPQISSVSVSSGVPGYGMGAYATSLISAENDRLQRMIYLFIDHDFISHYKMDILEGRSFKKEMISDRDDAFVINESAVEAFGWSSAEKALGMQIRTGYGEHGTIIGVVKDFHFDGLQRKIEPLIFALGPNKGLNMFNKNGCITLTLNTENIRETIDFVKQKWQAFNQNIPFRYYFIDDIFNRYYQREEQTRRIISLFAFLGLFVSCLGLFGLTSFIAEQRTKEIGIRKVLGSSISEIILLLSKEFIKWILVANIIAWPLGYFAIKWWLQDFSYRINVGLMPFIVSALLALVIAILTVSYQSAKAALANPVESLRYE